MGNTIEPNRREIYRYLGYRLQTPDERITENIERCIGKLQEVITPGFVREEFALDTGAAISFAGLRVESKSLSRNLRGCTKLVLFAATLGIGPDRLIARASVTSPADMVLYQAASAAMIEAWCDEKNAEIKAEAAQHNLYARPRFSPGYGDFSLEHQSDIIRILQTPKRIGLTLTDALLMVPSKSVTGVIGLSTQEANCPLAGCEACEKTDCVYRRDTR